MADVNKVFFTNRMSSHCSRYSEPQPHLKQIDLFCCNAIEVQAEQNQQVKKIISFSFIV